MIFQPLADVIVSKYKEFLPKLVYPVRVGTHTNSAFGLIFAYEYANYTNDTELMSIIEETAKRHYAQDKYVQSIYLSLILYFCCWSCGCLQVTSNPLKSNLDK